MGVSKTITLIVVGIVLIAARVNGVSKKSLSNAPPSTSILQQVDRSINPCDDFYEFSCGNGTDLLKNIKIVSEMYQEQILELYNEPISDSDHYVTQLVKKLFRACLNVSAIKKDGIEGVKEVLDKLGGWPLLLGKNWNEEKFDWVQTTYKLRELGYTFSVFLEIVSDMEKDILEVSLPRSDLVRNSSEVTARLKKIATDLGGDRKQLANDIKDIIEFGEQLQQLINNSSYSENKEMKVEEYQQIVGSMNWVDFINKIISPAADISKRDKVIFPDADILKSWFRKIAKTPKRVQANFMLWKVIEQVIPHLDTDFQPSAREETRSDFCIKEVERRFPTDPLIILHDRKYLSEAKKTQVEQFVNSIKNEFAQLVKKFKWLSPEQRTAASDKANSLKVVVGLSAEYFASDVMNQLGIDLKPTTNHESFLELLAQANRNLESQKYSGIIKRLGYVGRNYGYMMYYISRSNTLYVPIAFLQPPLYDESRPNYLNYGSLGLLIAGELSGMYQTTDASKTEWRQLTNSTRAGFQKMIECADLRVLVTDSDLDFVRTIQVYAIAQRAAYEAYKKWAKNNERDSSFTGSSFTPNQLFWISSAFCGPKSNELGTSKWSQLAHLPVYTALRNNHNFARDFNCPSGARMNPTKKCELF